MKKVLTVIIFFTCLQLCKSQNSYTYFPTYEETVKKFFLSYSATNIPEGEELKFERRPDGWHVTIRAYGEGKPLKKDELFWSDDKKSFRTMDYIKINAEETNEKELNSYLTNWEGLNFHYCPYYGYPGWDWDVITIYKNAENLPDSILYGLGRAYSSYASNLLNNNSGYAEPKRMFVLQDGKNCLSAEQLETYRKYRHLAIETYRKVFLLNPKFETFVGKIALKVAHEQVTGFLELREYQNEAEAMKEPVDNIYDDFYISLAKNYLNSCEKNAILFTNGDTDTYPLLYVQSKYGFRPDVLVVNVSLLQTDRYINSFREPTLQAAALPLSLTAQQIKSNERELIIIAKKEPNSMPLKEFLNFIKDDKNIQEYGPVKYHYVNGKKLSLKTNGGTITWTLPFESYLYRSDIIMLDVIANSNTRPVYFALTLNKDAYLGLNGYLRLDGLAYKLESKKLIDPDLMDGHISSSILFDNLMNKFLWKGNDIVYSNDRLLCVNYCRVFYWLANTLLKEEKKDKAKQVIDTYFTLFPNEVCYFDENTLFLLECYFKLKENDKANKIADKLIYNVTHNINNEMEIKSTGISAELKQAILERLTSIAATYNQTELYSKAREAAK